MATKSSTVKTTALPKVTEAATPKTKASQKSTPKAVSEEKSNVKSAKGEAPRISNQKTEPLNLQAPKPQGAISCSSTGKGTKVTRIVVEFDVGFGNTLYIRGKGANLNWEKGLAMRNVKANEWVWETDAVFPTGEFKILINDAIYETGHNHALYCGTTLRHTPRF